MDDQALSVSVKVTEADVVQYLRDHGFYFWRVLLPVAVLFCVAAFVGLAVLPDGTALTLTMLGGIMSTATGVWWYRFYLRRQARRHLQATLGAKDGWRIEITPDGLAWSGTLSEGSMKWAAFAQIASTPEQIYFYRHRRVATIIPRHAFASPEESEAFLQAAAQWHAAALSSTRMPG